MGLFSILSFALSSSGDNFIIGLNYGIKKIKINNFMNLIVASISCLGTILAMLLGNLISDLVSPKYSNIIGGLTLISFGLYMLITSIIKTNNNNISKQKTFKYFNLIDNPELLDTNNSKTIDFKEAISLGILLSLNNIGLGIGASIAGLNIVLTSFFSFLFSFLFIKIGFAIGGIFSFSKLSKVIEIVTSCMIILLGLYELFFNN
ncbi:MAG TPA: sporulation membrane protein YtaF [Clostridiales bacterium]|nr:sporulation membrane protein YtaF [Clostridiales bacterium]